jgi:hypothetical protein
MPMAALRPSRRAILVMLTATSAASAGGAYLWTIGPDALIGKILRRRLPGVRIDADSIATLSRDVQAALFKTLARRLALEGGALATSIIGIDTVAEFPPTKTEFYRLERIVLTFFILGSNFLDVRDPKLNPVSYYTAPGACPNRFAKYDG